MMTDKTKQCSTPKTEPSIAIVEPPITEEDTQVDMQPVNVSAAVSLWSALRSLVLNFLKGLL